MLSHMIRIRPTPPPPPHSYNLYAVVNHQGTANSGHYTSYIRLNNSRWYHCEDNKIRLVDVDEVLASEALVGKVSRNGGE